MSAADEVQAGDKLHSHVSGLAAAARSALHCDGLLVTHRDDLGHVHIAVEDGLGALARTKLARAATRIDGWATVPSVASLPDLLGRRNAWAADLVGHGFDRALFVPIVRDRRTIGVLTALRSADDFSDSELDIAQAFAQHFDVALTRRARIQPDSLTGLLRGLEEVNRTAEAMNVRDLCAMFDAALEPILGPVHTGLAVWDEEQGGLRLVSSTFPVETWQASVTDLESSTVRVFLSGSPYVTDHALTDPGVLTSQAHRFGTEQFIQIQLNVAGQPIGVVSIALANRPTPEDLEAVERLAPHLATVIHFASTTTRLRRDVELTSAVSELAMTIANSDTGASKSWFDKSLGRLRSALAAHMIALVEYDGTSVADTAPGAIDVGRHALRLAALHPDGIQQVRVSTTSSDGGWLYTIPVALSADRIGTIAALRQGDDRFGDNESLALQRVANLIALAWSKDRHWQQTFRLVKLEERERLANDLHDDVAQLLFAAQVSLDLAVGSEERSSKSVTHARELMAAADDVIRKLIHERADPARPEFKQGLSEAVSQVERDYGITVDLEMSADHLLPRVPTAVTSTLIRVVREALVNVAKHAGGYRAQVCVEAGEDDQLVIVIADNGSGVAGDNAHRGYGLTSMRRSLARHGGTFHVSFTPTGTTVTATVRVSG